MFKVFPSFRLFVPVCLAALLLTGCTASRGILEVSAVTYQAIETRVPQKEKIASVPESAKIFVTYAIDKNGKIAVVVNNLTDSIMTIDQEKSFLLNTTGESVAFYNPNTYSNTTTDYSFATVGTGLTLTALGDAFTVLPAPWLSSSSISTTYHSTIGSSVSNTITIVDRPQINIAPRGTAALPNAYPIIGVGQRNVPYQISASASTYESAPMRFSTFISYSLDGGRNYHRLETQFYVSASLYIPVQQGAVNSSLRSIMNAKPDLFVQPWYEISFDNNLLPEPSPEFYLHDATERVPKYDSIVHGLLYDYQ